VGGVTVTLTSSSQNVSFAVPECLNGTPCITTITTTKNVFIAAGQTTPAVQPQVTGYIPGPVTVGASALAYLPATTPVQVTATFAFTPPTLNINGASSGQLFLALSGHAAAPPIGLTVTLTSSNPGVATVPQSYTIFWDGSTQQTLSISVSGVASGTTTITASSPFMADATATVTVTGPVAITTTSLPQGFQGQPYTASVTAGGGTTPYTFTAVGLPTGLNINSSTGQITGTPGVSGTSNVAITVTDSTNPTHQTVTVNLSLNIVAPLSITTTSLPGGVQSQSYNATVSAIGGTNPITFTATGLPTGLSISATGQITGIPATPGTVTAAITATDSTNPTHLTATANLSITIVAPVTITTTSPLPGGVVGTAYSGTVAATGGTPPITWTATGLPAGLGINASTGAITGNPTTAGTTTASITATDSTNPTHLTATANLSITIVAPVSITTASLPGGTVGTAYSATVAASGGTLPITWTASGLPGGLGINASTGAITGNPTAAGTFTAAITATDSTNPTHLTATANLSISIAGPLTITTSSLPDGIQGQAYATTVTAGGGTGPYTWSASGLPSGLGINVSTGQITGIPAAAGTTTAAITVTDSTSPTHLSMTVNLSIRIVLPLSITTASLPAGIVGTAYNTSVASNGGASPITWSATGLPGGLGINASTGAITGTPTTPGTVTAGITATDATNPTHQVMTANLSISIVGPLTITTSSLPGGLVGTAYTATVTAAGGTNPVTWNASNLPAGLGINSLTGAITGNPTTAGTTTAAITATDSTNPTHQTATANLSITIVAPVTITTTSPLPGGVVGTAYNTTVAATGGTNPITWTATNLPAGLGINAATGAITGNPTTPGTTTAVVTATDSTNPTHLMATANLSITIVAPLTITTTSPLPGGVVGTAYNTNVAATGGTNPITWNATNLPGGLGINASTGAITGSPTTPGTTTAVVTATDSTNPTHLTATANLSITIVAPVTITTTSPLPGGVVGTAYNTTVTATGGTNPITWNATNLPAGLGINPATGAITGSPTTPGTTVAVVTATDSTNPTHLTATANLSITILNPVTFTTTSPLPTGVQNQAYSTTVAATGGTGPITFTAPGLPAGLSINASTGAITGTPTVVAVNTVAITATDSTLPTHLTATVNFSLTIVAPLNITTATLPSGIQNTPYSTTVAATGGTTPYSWSASGLPTGLNINASTGAITGTPTVTGTFTASITVTDVTLPTHLTLTVTRVLTINAPSPGSLTAISGGGQSAVVNSPFGAQLQVEVRDGANNLLSGVQVLFTAPSSGASLTFAGGTNTVTLVTNSFGSATTPIMTANGTAGTYTVSASLPGFPGIVAVTFTMTNTSGTSGGTLGVSSTNVGQNLQTTVIVSIPAVSASDTSILVSSGAPSLLKMGNAGLASVTITIAAGQTQASVVVQGQTTNGPVTVTASAAGYTNGAGTVTVTPSGFVLAGANGIGASFSTFQNVSTTMTVSVARLDSTAKFAETQALRATYGSNVIVNVTSTSAGTVTPTSVTFQPGDSSGTVSFKALSTGTANITAVNPDSSIFNSVTDGSNVVVATILSSGLVPDSGITVGNGLAATAKFTLNGVTSVITPLTISVDPASLGKIQLSATPTGACADSITLTLAVNAHVSPDFVICGGANSGTATYTGTASGFGSAQGSVTQAPSGIVFATGFGTVPNPILTTPTAAPTTITVYSGILTAAGDFSAFQPLKGGSSATVAITKGSEVPSAGSVSPSSVTIVGGAGSATAQFTPANAATTTLTLGLPGGPFSTPSAAFLHINVTVTVPGISCSANGTQFGQNLQGQNSCSLGQAAPAGGLLVTLTTSGQLLAAANPTDTGLALIQVTVPAGGTSFVYYLQATGGTGTATYSASATGYTTGTGTVTLTPAGLVLSTTASGLPFAFGVPVGTTVSINVETAQLDPATGAYVQKQQLRGGLTLSNVTLSSNSPGVATVDSPVTLVGGSSTTVTTLMHAVAAGSGVSITVNQPANFVASTNTAFSGNPASTFLASTF
jgi:hypothetical protein